MHPRPAGELHDRKGLELLVPVWSGFLGQRLEVRIMVGLKK